ncbi:hypothetical protein Tco_0008474 [Tanacetum coccineum]
MDVSGHMTGTKTYFLILTIQNLMTVLHTFSGSAKGGRDNSENEQIKQRLVLVTKPHNPRHSMNFTLAQTHASISFMRPFGCPVNILNTLYPLGKFDRNAEEGFLVGYSINSKAFRVFNSQTRKVKENLHVNFLEKKPIYCVPLTNSMNYQPVTVGNQTNKNAGPQEANGDTGLKKSVDARQSEEKNVSTQQYIVFPLWSSIFSSYKISDETYKNNTADDAAGKSPIQKPASENEQVLKNVLDKMIDQEKEAIEQSDTNQSLYSTWLIPFPLNVNDLPNDPLMPDLEDTAKVQNTGIFGSAYDDDDLDTYNSPYAGLQL